MDKQAIANTMRDHFEEVWRDGNAWSFDSSPYEKARFEFQMKLLSSRHFGRTLEIGCGAGNFTRRLASVSDHITALDISTNAVELARAKHPTDSPSSVDFIVANIMEYDLSQHESWDLVVFSETIYCLGWLYPMFDVGMLAFSLCQSMKPSGQLLLSNTYGAEKDWLLKPWLIDTYHDLFEHVGFRLVRDEMFEGEKDGVPLQVRSSLFEAPDAMCQPSGR